MSNDKANADIAEKIKTSNAPVFFNNLGCQLHIDDALRELALSLFTEVSHKLKMPVLPSLETAINIMIEAGKYCADVESTKAEMLNALSREYGLRKPSDKQFATAKRNCVLARETKHRMEEFDYSPTEQDFKCLLADFDKLRQKINNFAERFVLANPKGVRPKRPSRD